MAKVSQFSDDLLIEAVVKYADQFGGKIVATDLASWASANISGLENVRYYHFTRPVTKTVNGKKVFEDRLCTKRINEINSQREVLSDIKMNPVLTSADVNAFLAYPAQEQRQAILDARKYVDEVIARCARLERENESFKGENKILRERAESDEARMEELTKNQERIERLIKKALERADEQERIEVLEAIGITDGHIDFKKNVKSMTIGKDEMFSFNDAVKSDKITTDIIGGVDF